MSFMSRFLKSGKEKEEEEDLEDAELIGDLEDEGLLVSTGPVRAQPAAEEAAGPEDELLAAAAQPATVGEAEAQAELAAAAADEPAAVADAPAEPEPAVEAEPEKVEESSENDDDPLALFRTSATETKASGLTSEVEDVPVEDLVADLREIRELLKLPDQGAETEAG